MKPMKEQTEAELTATLIDLEMMLKSALARGFTATAAELKKQIRRCKSWLKKREAAAL